MQGILASFKLTPDQFEVKFGRFTLLQYHVPSRGDRIKWAMRGFGEHPDDQIVSSEEEDSDV